MTRHLHDLDFLTSVGLLAAALVTAATGIIADLWDLNDFWYHTVAGYVTVVFGITHVLLNRHRLTGYARFRWRSLTNPAGPPARPAPRRPVRRDDAQPASPGSMIGRALVSRRGLFGLSLGAIGGYLLGRGLRPPPIIERARMSASSTTSGASRASSMLSGRSPTGVHLWTSTRPIPGRP